jgi:hypothetical protein
LFHLVSTSYGVVVVAVVVETVAVGVVVVTGVETVPLGLVVVVAVSVVWVCVVCVVVVVPVAGSVVSPCLQLRSGAPPSEASRWRVRPGRPPAACENCWKAPWIVPRSPGWIGR